MSKTPNRFIDIGANLLDEMFQGVYNGKVQHSPDLLSGVLPRAKLAGASHIFVTAGTIEDSRRALEFARSVNNNSVITTSPLLKTTVGIHPTQALRVNPLTIQSELLELALEGKKDGTIIAIGECGLDKDRIEFCPFDIQLKIWREHFSLCNVTKLPMFIHSRNCAEDTISMLKEFPLTCGGVVHSFDGELQSALEILEISDKLYIGINGCSLKTKENLETVKHIPIEKILVETDAPWCEIKATNAAREYLIEMDDKTSFPIVNKPHQLKGKENTAMVKNRNEPCNTIQVLSVIAKLKNMEIEKCSQIVYENTLNLFGKM